MARRKKGNPINGWLILDKPKGMTSTQAVGKIRWLFNARKAGHAGTLDPLATGILPIALGEATKTVSYAVDGAKSYRFTVRWGVETDTDDTEGAVIMTSDNRPDRAAIQTILPEFTGQIMQRPPAFSAIKVDGERAYDLAREGHDVELTQRPVTINRLAIADQPDNDHTVFEADCGKGTYVRSLARDMGRALGCYGHVTALRRTVVGGFTEDDAISLDELIEIGEERREDGSSIRITDPNYSGDGDPTELMDCLLPVESALDELFELQLGSSDAARLQRGQSVLIRGRDAPIMTGDAYAICKGDLIALGKLQKGQFVPTRVFNLGG